MFTRAWRSLLLFVALTFIFAPLLSAEETLSARILITEVQTEDQTALEDFIEITNVSGVPVDVTGWEIQTKATGATSDWIKRTELNGVLYPEGSLLVSYDDEDFHYLSDIAAAHFSTSLSTTGGHVRLFATDTALEEDKLGWGTATDPEGNAAPKALKPQSLTRKKENNIFIDTNDNAADFELDTPSPRAENAAPEEEEPPVEEPEEELPVENPEEETPIEEPEEEAPPTETPPEERQLPVSPIRINELMINPASPETDDADEWIELYNPNGVEVDLTDYRLQTGSTFSYNFTLKDISIPAHGYVAFVSQDTNLTLSNSGGAVRLIDFEGNSMDALGMYSDVEEGEAYAWHGGSWQWTTTPTKNAENVITRPMVVPKAVKTATSNIKKATAVKASSSSKKTTTTKASAKKASTEREVFEDPAAIETEPPLHPTVLAGVGSLAVLYGGYEYREDFSHRLRKLKRYLGFRRSNRP